MGRELTTKDHAAKVSKLDAQIAFITSETMLAQNEVGYMWDTIRGWLSAKCQLQ